MDDVTKILLTSSLTVFGGVLVFTIGQLLGKFVIEPVHELKKLLGEIRFALIFHAQAIMTPVGDRASEDEASKVIRKLSSDLRAKVGAIPFYESWANMSCGFLPTKKNAYMASTQLMGLSNSMHQPDRSDKNGGRVSKLEQLLNFEPVE